LSEIQTSNLLFDLVSALRSQVDVSCSDAYVQGMTGACLVGSEVPVLARDLWAMFLPALPALGLKGELLSLSPTDLLSRLRERLARRVPVVMFGFSGFLSPTSEPSEQGETEREGGEWEEPHLVCMGTVERLTTEGNVVWYEVDGTTQEATPEEVCRQFSHFLRLTKTVKKGHRRENIRHAILRWVAFSAAFPERIPTEGGRDAAVRLSSEAFLREIAGKMRTPVALRWRYAADCFSEEDVPQALDYLREAALRELHLPPSLYRALLDPDPKPLDGAERRELIYLARAGIPHLRTLAAERLLLEVDNEEVWRTLEQLCYDPSYWVRSVARTLYGIG
jgi:hypothetical protein